MGKKLNRTRSTRQTLKIAVKMASNSVLLDSENHIFMVLDFIEVTLFPMPWWHGVDYNDEKAVGSMFYGYEDPSSLYEVTFLIVDATDDDEEWDVYLINPTHVEEFDEDYKKKIESHCTIVEWMGTVLNDTGVHKALVTAYVAQIDGRDWLFIDYRINIRDRKIVISAGCDNSKTDLYAKLVYDAAKSVSFIQPVYNSPLRKSIRDDFKIDLPIIGEKHYDPDSPLIIDVASSQKASIVEMRLINCIIQHGRKRMYRVISSELQKRNDKTLHYVTYDEKYPEGDVVYTDTGRMLFDVSKVTEINQLSVLLPYCMLKLGKRYPFSFPYQFDWVHFDMLIDFEKNNPGLGVCLKYSAVGINVSIYVYNHQQDDDGYKTNYVNFIIEFNQASLDIIYAYPDAKLLKEMDYDENILFRSYDIDGAYSMLTLSTAKGFYVKARISTNSTDKFVFENMWVSSASIIKYVDYLNGFVRHPD